MNKYRGAEWAAATVGAGHESHGTCDLKLVSTEARPLRPDPCTTIPIQGVWAAWHPGTCAHTDRWRGRAGKSVPTHSLAKGAQQQLATWSLPPEAGCSLDKAPPRATSRSDLRAPPVGRPQAAGPGKGWAQLCSDSPARWPPRKPRAAALVPGTAGSPVSEPLRGDTPPLLRSPSHTQAGETSVGTAAKQVKQRHSRGRAAAYLGPQRLPAPQGGP